MLTSAQAAGAGEAALAAPNYGASLLATLGALAVVCALAWFALRLLARRGFGQATGGKVTILDRISVGPRRGVLVLGVGARVILVAESDGGMQTLLELPREEWDAAPSVDAPSFSAALGAVREKLAKQADDEGEAEGSASP